MKKYKEIIWAAPLFKNIEPNRITELLEKEKVFTVKVKKNESITDMEKVKESLAMVLSGSLEVRKNNQGHRIILNILYPGHLFGMATLFYQSSSEVSQIKARENSVILVLPKEWVESAMAQEPQLVKNYIGILSQRIHFLNKKIDEFTAGDSKDTLLQYLQSQAGPEGTVEIPTSMTKLANSLNLSRPSLYRAIKKLEQEEVITSIDNKVFKLNNYN